MPKPCQCSGPGFCSLYQREQSQRHWELCANQCPEASPCTEYTSLKYREKWTKEQENGVVSTVSQVLAKPNPTPVKKARGKPGAVLKRLIRSLGFTEFKGCSCNSVATWMDSIGIDGCVLHKDKILEKLRESQKQLGWLDKITAGWNAISHGLAFKFNPLDPAVGLLEEALRLAEEEYAGLE